MTNLKLVDNKRTRHEYTPEFEKLWQRWPKSRRGAKKACGILHEGTVQPGGMDTNIKLKESGTRVVIHLEGTADEIYDGALAYINGKRKPDSYEPDLAYFKTLEVFLNRGEWEQ